MHREGARWFYKILSRALHVEMENTSDFKLLDRKVVESVLRMPEQHLFFRAISSWVGYQTAQVLSLIHIFFVSLFHLLYQQLAGLKPKVIVAGVELDFSVVDVRDMGTYFIQKITVV